MVEDGQKKRVWCSRWLQIADDIHWLVVLVTPRNLSGFQVFFLFGWSDMPKNRLLVVEPPPRMWGLFRVMWGHHRIISHDGDACCPSIPIHSDELAFGRAKCFHSSLLQRLHENCWKRVQNIKIFTSERRDRVNSRRQLHCFWVWSSESFNNYIFHHISWANSFHLSHQLFKCFVTLFHWFVS